MTVQQAIELDLSIIPTGANKRPLIRSWKPYQLRKPTSEELNAWFKMKPPTWAIVTGAISGCVTLDFDGESGKTTLQRLALNPHRQTPSGGYHVDFQHPGWRVATLNGKSKHVLGEQWPGLDIRADGGYVLFTGRTTNGSYTWLREFSPYNLDLLPFDLRRFLNLSVPLRSDSTFCEDSSHRDSLEHKLLQRALRDANADGRNNAGFWLACQLRDAGYTKSDAEAVLRSYARQVSSTNTKEQFEPYTEAEVEATVRQAYSSPPRRPWNHRHERTDGNNNETGAAEPPKYAGESYCFHAGGIWGFRGLRDNPWVPFRVTNFEATIVSDRVLDDGADETRWFIVRATMNRRTEMIEIGAKDFRSMNWVTERLGGMAIVYPGQVEHARTAIQYLSRVIPTIRAFSHTGWRSLEDEQHYLHSGGAIGPHGNRTDVQVSLLRTLPNYSLPAPPTGAHRAQAIRASLAVLDIAPDRITFPLLAGVYRAILGPTTFSIHIDGPSGQGKSQLAALVQQHFGPQMDSEHLPASWDDTALAAMTLAFFAKDAVLVVDDFVLSGNAARQQKLHAEADRLLRSQANASGRRRVTTDGTLRSSHPPRGLIVSTGENTPRGKSLNARMIIIPFPKGAMNWPRLTECQIAAGRGDLAAAAAAYIKWVAPQLSDLQGRMAEMHLERRKDVTDTSSPHKRTPENLASLSFGLRVFLEFALESSSISPLECRTYEQRSELAFREVAKYEHEKHSTNDPARIFLRSIRTAITMGRAHVVAASGGPPDNDAAWGWQRTPETGPRIPMGPRIGWLKGSELCLDPEASFQVAAKLALERGESLSGTVESIKRDLRDEGYVRADERRRTTTIRRRFHGEDFDVLCFALKTFQDATLEYADNADNTDNLSDGAKSC